MTTIYAPDALIHELGDRVTMDVVRWPTNRIEHVKARALEQAKKVIDDLVALRMSAPLPGT